ncbi:formimidoylglutamate deiminase [Elioraea rosea]|uniref:formimidoylglutamate deiminase n=1 Tax=Elioraea rosea TaxID=2492390 RepID=UPI0011822FAB|nr:formimidoylglutamate deiminase [Elioraea rosea]
MRTLFAPSALLPDGWAQQVVITLDEAGTFAAISAGASPDGAERLAGPVLPGMTDVHSHAFQRAMAGLTERRGPTGDDHFWTWREIMYRFLARLSPDDVEAIAAHLCISLLKGGFTTLAEFHYLQADPDGRPYVEPGEMGLRIIEAARRSGMALTLLPSLYRQGGFGTPHTGGQKRFVLDDAALSASLARFRREAAHDRLLRVGLAPHSLRAAALGDIARWVATVRAEDAAAPIHIHAAEQPREVAECLAATGRRPVGLILEALPVDERWCLIHATHLAPEEIDGLAASGAVAGLCPTTEANLGDGVFPLPRYLEQQGRFAIGTDSHVGVAAAEELRSLEASQRLATLRRAVATTPEEPSAGTLLWRRAAEAGAAVCNQPAGAIAPGRRADLVVLDGASPFLAGRTGALAADTLVFAGGSDLVRDVMVGGTWVVRDKHHRDEERAEAAFAATMRRLLA